jgi:hypothetical protein
MITGLVTVPFSQDELLKLMFSKGMFVHWFSFALHEGLNGKARKKQR